MSESSRKPAEHPLPAPFAPAARDHARVKSRALVSPARDAAAFGLPPHPACPFCAGQQTELHSPFGAQLSVATYWCNACRTAFELLKWRNTT